MKWILTIVLALSLFIGACFDSTEPDPEPPATCDDIGAMLAVARQALETKLYEHLQAGADDPQTPDEVDFSAAGAAYQDAYDCEPANLEARFGLAICELLTMSVDPQVNTAFDEWQDYLDVHTPFERPEKSGGRPLAKLIDLPTGPSALQLPFDFVGHALMANLSAAAAGTEPQIAEVQTILLNVVLPRLQAAVALLAPVGDAATFGYVVSGRMQGDEEEDDAEIDRADVLALLAGCRLLEAGIHVAVAYDLQFSAYDDAGLLAGLDRASGNILRLRDVGGEAHMQAVTPLFLAAVEDVDVAITSLLAETDNQNNDVIKVGPDGASRADLTDLQDDYLPDVRQSFASGGVVRTEDWDLNDNTPDVGLRVNLAAFFANPVEDWKQVLPPYDLAVTTRAYDGWSWHHIDAVIGPVNVSVPSGYTDYSRYWNVWYEDYELDGTYGDGLFPGFTDACNSYIATVISQLEGDASWTGNAGFYFNDYGSLQGGTVQAITIDVSRSYSTAETFVYVPVVTWDAITYAQWQTQWTNQTLNGLLPGMADAAELCETFGFSETDWSPSFVWDWSDLGKASVPVDD